MAVIINELEHIPEAAPGRADGRGGDGQPGSAAKGQPADIEAQLMQVLRREASRQARLWAD
jgi:hypothetical protein